MRMTRMPVYGTLTMTTWKIWLACLRKSMVRTCNLIYFPFDDNVGVVKLSPVSAQGLYQSSYLFVCLSICLSINPDHFLRIALLLFYIFCMKIGLSKHKNDKPIFWGKFPVYPKWVKWCIVGPKISGFERFSQSVN